MGVGLEDLDVGVALNVARPHLARFVHLERQRLGVIDVQLEGNLLQVEDDVGRILDHAGDRRELMEHALDLHRRNRGAFDRRQQHAPQRVADRRAKAALEGLRVESAESIGERLTLEFEPLGSLKTFPEHQTSFLLRGSLPRIRYGPAAGPPDLQVAADLTPQVCVRLRVGGCDDENYE